MAGKVTEILRAGYQRQQLSAAKRQRLAIERRKAERRVKDEAQEIANVDGRVWWLREIHREIKRAATSLAWILGILVVAMILAGLSCLAETIP